MKTFLLSSLICIFFFDPTIYNFKVKSIDEDKEINFAQFKGKKILIVNTACNSPYTFQLEGMQQLYSAYKEKIVVIGFPAGSDFGDQELKSNREIKDFCKNSYGITFPITEKVNAVGNMQHPVFQYLVAEAQKLGIDNPIKWNFTKFLLDENGQLIKVFPADVTPLSPSITSMLNNDRSWSLN